MKRYLVELEPGERELLAAITRKGSHRSQKVVNALVLLNCDEGESNERRATGREVAAAIIALVDAGVDTSIRDYQDQLAVDLARANYAIIGTDAYPRLAVNEPRPLTGGRAFTGRIESTDRVR